MTIFNDKYEHEISYAKDYAFASDFYPKHDCRYPLTELYKFNVKEKTGVSPYNCKISIFNMDSGFYNVYLYFWDIREVFTFEEYHEFRMHTLMRREENYFTLLFNDAMEQYPIKQLNNMRLNPNGVFVEDFRVRSLSYTADRAENDLKRLWASKYPQIVFTTRWDSALYLFFDTIYALNQFVENDSAEFKESSCDVLKKYDNDGFCNIKAHSFILDLLENYKNIGGRNYFNSDAMDGLKII